MKQRGFTLIELLVAIFILAILGVGATALMVSSLDNQQAMRERGESLESLGIGLSVIRRDLEQIIPRPGRDRFGDSQESPLVIFRDGDNDLLEFTRGGRRSFPGRAQGSSLERVRYALEDGRLLRYSAPVADPVNHTDWQQRVLMEEVRRLTFEYYDGDRWHDQWPPLQRPGASLPRAIALELDGGPWSDIRFQILLPEGLPDAG